MVSTETIVGIGLLGGAYWLYTGRAARGQSAAAPLPAARGSVSSWQKADAILSGLSGILNSFRVGGETPAPIRVVNTNTPVAQAPTKSTVQTVVDAVVEAFGGTPRALEPLSIRQPLAAFAPVSYPSLALGGYQSNYRAPAAPASGVTTVKNDVDLLARTLWGEARGEGGSGMEAVASVIVNRMRSSRYPSGLRSVVLQPWQFSMWNQGDSNGDAARRVTSSDSRFRDALSIAERALSGGLRDQTGGALHYHSTSISAPTWAAGARVSARIGRHIFYIGVA